MEQKTFAVVAAVIIVAVAIVLFTPNLTEQVSLAKHPLKEFDVLLSPTGYEPRSISVQLNDRVQLNVRAAPGTADLSQGLAIDYYSINAAVNSESEPTVIDFIASTPGTFPIYCSTCPQGPAAAGQGGQIVLIVQ
jgi:nitrous oxide reductase